jgi:hypothetical protein
MVWIVAATFVVFIAGLLFVAYEAIRLSATSSDK